MVGNPIEATALDEAVHHAFKEAPSAQELTEDPREAYGFLAALIATARDVSAEDFTDALALRLKTLSSPSGEVAEAPNERPEGSRPLDAAARHLVREALLKALTTKGASHAAAGEVAEAVVDAAQRLRATAYPHAPSAEATAETDMADRHYGLPS